MNKFTSHLKKSSLYLCIMAIILSCNPTLKGQSPVVGSASYRVMLKSLLDHSVPEMSVETAAKLHGKSVFLDAREESEYEVSHIADAQFVGYDHFDINSVKDIPKNKPIIVYCSVGYRSEKISEQLIAAGYTDVHNMYGGLFEWKNQDYKVIDSTGNQTKKVHAFNKSWGVWLKKGKKVY